MQEIRNIIKLIAGADVTVLVCGDSGVCHHDVDPAELHRGGNARIEIPALDDIGAHELRRDAQRRTRAEARQRGEGGGRF